MNCLLGTHCTMKQHNTHAFQCPIHVPMSPLLFAAFILSTDCQYQGVSDLSERAGFFRAIADATPAALAHVYNDAEGLFARLAAELKKYQVGLITLCMGYGCKDAVQHLATVQHLSMLH